MIDVFAVLEAEGVGVPVIENDDDLEIRGVAELVADCEVEPVIEPDDVAVPVFLGFVGDGVPERTEVIDAVEVSVDSLVVDAVGDGVLEREPVVDAVEE